MYHDQGHSHHTVGFVYDRGSSPEGRGRRNITLGLPIVRVSVDYGAQAMLAGTGTSNELSLVNSIAYAQASENRT